MKKTRILSVDGGGIKGIVPAVVLLHLENHLNLDALLAAAN